MRVAITATALLLAACQSNVSTPFPAGLTPFENNPLPDPLDHTTEMLVTKAPPSVDMIRVYGKGYVLVAPSVVWAASKDPTVMYAACKTDEQTVTYDPDPLYELSYLVHYVVNDVVTVEWDDQWRYGIIEGTDDAPTFGMVKHQKVMGSSFIDISEGTIQILATDDPYVTELAFVEHLQAVSGGVGDVTAGMQHNYDALVAVSHGNPIPACP